MCYSEIKNGVMQLCHKWKKNLLPLTEAGLPIVDMLAKKISAANGELVRTKDIMAMISKREIPFEMVAEVFDDMTNKGGIFYNMQEKQGNTLYGLWQKLGDAADIMYSEIGNTGFVNNSLKDAISFTRTLMVNWKATGTALLGLIAILGSYAMHLQKLKLQSAMNSAANQKYISSLCTTFLRLILLWHVIGARNSAISSTPLSIQYLW